MASLGRRTRGAGRQRRGGHRRGRVGLVRACRRLGGQRACGGPQRSRRARARRKGSNLGRIARCAGAGQGQPVHDRLSDDVRFENPRRLSVALRCDRDPPSARSGCGDRGQRQHGRVRDGLLDRAQLLRTDAQSVRSHAGSRRIERRTGGRGRLRPVPGGTRVRHRGLGAPARRVLRCVRIEADLRAAVALRVGRVRFIARSGWHLRAARGGCGAGVRDPRGPRSVRCDHAARSSARGGRFRFRSPRAALRVARQAVGGRHRSRDRRRTRIRSGVARARGC